MKILVAGWFSFENGHATAGDLLARDLACKWLDEAGVAYDIALAPPFQGGVDLRSADPIDYSHALFVCGPFEQGELEAEFFDRWGGCRLIGLNLSMPVPLETWNPWDALFERDSSVTARPDIVFLTRQSQVPVVGVCLVEEYEGAAVAEANAAIKRLLASTEMAVVEIDTRLDTNSAGLRTPAEIEALIARLDLLVTTRLHGTVLALKNGVPAVVIDPQAGGAKLRRQAETIGWPIIFNVDALTDEALHDALNYCLTEAARNEARACRDRAISKLEATRAEFISVLMQPEKIEPAYRERVRAWETKRAAAASATAPAGTSRHRAPFGSRLKHRIRGTLRHLVRRMARRA